MDKIKQVLSGGHKHDENVASGQGVNPSPETSHPTSGLHGEGSHLAGANKGLGQQGAGSAGEHHPIYDQFAGRAQNDSLSTGTTGNTAPNFSLPSHTKDSGLHPESAGNTHRPAAPREDVSNASIKSGILGAPPSSTQRQANFPQPTEHSHLGRDAAIGGGLGAGASALGGHERDRTRESDIGGTDRAFPLVGGVASSGQRTQEPASAHQPMTSRTTGPAGDAGLNDGREGLAGAAASTAWTEHERKEPGMTSGVGSTTGPNDGPHFTHGPHITDTANRLDPHIPGSFPESTPTEEKQEPSSYSQTGRDAALGGAGAATVGGLAGHHHHDRATEPTARSVDTQPTSEHHYGRDAALAGGAGAAGLGAYEASRHHGQDNRDPVTGQSSPYSSKQLDPRVHGSSTAATGTTSGTQQPTSQPEYHHGQPGTSRFTESLEEQRFDPPARSMQGPHDNNRPSEHHYGRDAALGAGAGAAGLGAYEASQQRTQNDSGPASSTIGPHKSNLMNVLDPRAQPEPALQKQHHAASTDEDPASATVGRHKSNLANIMDPRVLPQPEKQKGHTTTGPHQSDTFNKADPRVKTDSSQAQPESQHHYGRDAALAGGAGAAGLGAYEAGKHREGPQDTSRLPSTAQGTAQQYGEHRLTQPTAALNEQRYDPTVQGAHDPTKPKDHHYGRDAALAGGVGAAGLGTYETSRHHGQDARDPMTSGTQQSTSATHPTTYTQQPNVGRQDFAREPANAGDHHYGRDAALAGGAGAAGLGAYEASRQHGKDYRDPTVGTQQPLTSQQPPSTTQRPIGGYEGTQDPTGQHHYGRDAALAGGAGAAGYGGYEALKHHGERDPRDPTGTAVQQPPSYQDPTSHQPYDSTITPEDQQRYNKARDAAAVGAAGVTGVGAEHEYSKHEAEKAEKERLKELERQQKAADKEAKKEEKQHEKALAADQKKREHEAEKEEKQHEKALVAEQKKREHEAEKEAKKEEKQHEKVLAAEEKKHNKELVKEEKAHEKELAKEEKLREKELEKQEHHKGRDAAALGAAGAAGVGAEHEYSKHEDEKIGKEEKPGLLDRLLHRNKGPSEEEKLHSGVYTADDGRNKLHKEPPPGHPAREAAERLSGEHYGTDGKIGGSNLTSGDRQTQAGTYGAHQPGHEHQHVIEPHTGLPMNPALGSGAGGTDGNATIHGYHGHNQPGATGERY